MFGSIKEQIKRSAKKCIISVKNRPQKGYGLIKNKENVYFEISMFLTKRESKKSLKIVKEWRKKQQKT